MGLLTVAQEQKNAQALLKQLEVKVDQLRSSARGGGLQVARQKHANDVHLRRQSIIEERKQAELLIEQRKQRDLEERRLRRQEEEERRSAARSQLYDIFDKRRSDIVAQRDEWRHKKQDSKHDDEEWRSRLHQFAQEEREQSRSRKLEAAMEIERSKTAMSKEKRAETKKFKTIAEERRYAHDEETAEHIRQVRDINTASRRARDSVLQRNQQLRGEVVGKIRELREREMRELAKEMLELQREQSRLGHQW